MKQLITLLFCLITGFLTAQTNISGVINTYTPVQNIDACTSEVTVANASGFVVGDKVMIIQMKGTSIVSENNADFGTVTDLGNCGLYELSTITNVTGNVISLGFALINDYDITGKVQLVTVPVYESAIVTGDLLAQNWDGETGGVVAVEVETVLTLNADINADGAGFRGGQINIITSDCNAFVNQDDYFYETGNWRGSQKGEGIAQEILDKEWGRGPLANGGGGGNDHNAGGGGGGNVFKGGQGGNRSPDGFLDCDGDFPGLGGIPFAATSNRAFLGGGGGAGHSNNAGAGSAGGNGGGLIFVKASALESGGNTITTQGLSNNTGGDGAGGGGAGGTVILQINNTTGMPTINTLGGNGGNTVGSADACSGPGGGGAGGRVLTNNPVGLGLQFTAGTAGINTGNLTECSGASNGATDGQQGGLDIIDFVPESTQEISEVEITQQPVSTLMVCEGADFTLTAEAVGLNLMYQWQVDFGDGFENLIESSSAYSGALTNTLTVNSPNTTMTGWVFQLIVTGACGETVNSDTMVLTVNPTPVAGFTYVNVAPFTFEFTDTSTGSFSTSWDFGDMSGGSGTNPTQVYTEAGCYTVTQIISSPCGTVTSQQEICLAQQPTAAFSSNLTSGCATLNIQFQNESLGMPTMLEWQFPGGLPNAITNDPQPIIIYPNSGVYDVILIVTNEAGSDTITQTAYIEVAELPTADFTFAVEDNLVIFTNTSDNADTYSWDFGDMNNSILQNPQNLYDTQGTYDVTLTVTNDCGSNSTSLQIITGSIPSAGFTSGPSSGCAPIIIQFNDGSTGNPTEWFWQFPGGTPATSNQQNPSVTYTTAGFYTVSLAVANTAGNNFVTQENYVVVETFPMPDFTFEIDMDNPLQVNFTNQTSGSVNQYLWDFGDGNTSSEFDISHIYENGATTYNVTLNAINSSCGAANSQAVTILYSSTEDYSILPTVQVFPSPFTDDLYVNFKEMPDASMELRLTAIDGRIFNRQIINNQQNVRFSTDNLPSGIYILQMIYEGDIFGVRVVK
ncbi:MAG: PKD repeat protein [Saprospiraceae bacterium]|jgi:PKD repeat protein